MSIGGVQLDEIPHFASDRIDARHHIEGGHLARADARFRACRDEDLHLLVKGERGGLKV